MGYRGIYKKVADLEISLNFMVFYIHNVMQHNIKLLLPFHVFEELKINKRLKAIFYDCMILSCHVRVSE